MYPPSRRTFITVADMPERPISLLKARFAGFAPAIDPSATQVARQCFEELIDTTLGLVLTQDSTRVSCLHRPASHISLHHTRPACTAAEMMSESSVYSPLLHTCGCAGRMRDNASEVPDASLVCRSVQACPKWMHWKQVLQGMGE
jgi:hypothetical protein